ncbi:hypothetical protein [Mucilaginibacter jinjuensis]|uniref:Uncharacterized protein n=1 Tax=Mucilaginibacter jinjuensis TaxID=1176721 RepID=A0ABY7TEI1_9SPHI|nr:hypothetical protein [Mucilaginibacter jinjuensis]WCT13582.1 hypothetical protein PQO05_06480 [Mucilaginibacter jinjuensis]
MKRNNIPKAALIIFISGLLISTVMPVAGRYFFLPDFVKGVIMGLGLALEVIALVIFQRSKKDASCTVWNN